MRAVRLAVPALLLVAAPAVAAPRPSCHLIRDARGEATTLTIGDPATQPNAEVLDIVGGDVGSTSKMLTAVIRLADLAADNPHVQNGWGYEFSFGKKGYADARFYFRSTYDSVQDRWVHEYGFRTSTDQRLGTPVVVLDVPRDEIRYSIPFSALAQRTTFPKGTRLERFGIRTWDRQVVVTQYQDNAPDPAAKGTSYAVGAPTCVRVAR